MDKCLPFGLRSAPFLFNMVADALQWILVNYFGISNLFHYLDDFFFIGLPGTSDCHQALQALCQAVQAPLKPEKVIGPATLLIILGIELDTIKRQARLPQEKLTSLLEELHSFILLHRTERMCTKRQLLSLIGKLAFACKVIPAGRIFLMRLLDTAHCRDCLSDKIPISDDGLQDILWWQKFARGTAFFLEPNWTPAPELQLFTDAASTLGFGVYWNGAWFSQPWPPHLASKSIEWKELYAILIACETWGAHWSGKRILFHCDNQAVVQVWDSGLSWSSDLMYLVRALFFVAAHKNFNVLVRHIRGVNNSIADSLSRLQLPRFRTLAPLAEPTPTPILAKLTFDSH